MTNLQTIYEKSLDCVHCGLCLPACPTYEQLSNEADSPRGRIYLMRAMCEGRIDEADPGILPPLSRCLNCRACESACPSGVEYGAMLEEMRAKLREIHGKSIRAFLERKVLDLFVAWKAGHRLAIGMTGLMQATGAFGMLKLLPLPMRIAQALRLLPKIPRTSERAAIRPGVHEAFGKQRAFVGLFTGCMMESLFGRVNRALLYVLRKNGCRVHVPQAQGCCGALHLHAGFRERTRSLALHNVGAFPADLDAIILDSAGCGTAMKEYGDWIPEARAFSSKVRDMSEFLHDLGVVAPQGRVLRKVVYDDPCHLCHGQGVREQPRELLRAIPGLQLIELEEAESCCGSAGVYNIVEPVLANGILARKVEHILASGADCVVTGNPGCQLQLGMGLHGSGVEVLHLAELLERAARGGSPDAAG